MSETLPEGPGYRQPARVPVPARRERALDPLFVLIGVLTSIAAYAFALGLGSAGSSIMQPFAQLPIPVSAVAAVVSLAVGVAAGRTRVRSFGLGALVVHGVVMLGLLLLFGTCLLSLGAARS